MAFCEGLTAKDKFIILFNPGIKALRCMGRRLFLKKVRGLFLAGKGVHQKGITVEDDCWIGSNCVIPDV